MMSFRSVIYSVLVLILASAVTAGGIKAADYLQGHAGVCPDDMIEVTSVPGITCVDRYEAMPDSACLHQIVDGPQVTKGNITLATCVATGDLENAEPWRFVTREEARTLCARSGKRLPTAVEWYNLALSTQPQACVFNEQTAKNSDNDTTCVSVDGARNMPGNVWEWVSDDVIDGQYSGRQLPESGYVEAVDAGGVMTLASTTPVGDFGFDYTRTAKTGVMGMVRGGFYGSGEDGGIYALQANISPTFASAGIGFRCVR